MAESNKSDYIIGGGSEGKKRLDVLSAALYPTTKALLQMDGPLTGKSVLDVGCGGGNVSLMAAQLVGATGHVTAIDFDLDMIALAQQDAGAKGVGNVSFRAASAYDISYHNEFDVAYTRFLLSHLKDSQVVLSKMLQSVKPGGRVVVEDVQFGGHFCYPACEAFERYLQFYAASATARGQNCEIGPALFSMFSSAGIRELQFDVIQPCFADGPGKWMALYTLDRIKHTVIEQGIADEHTVNDVRSQLEAFTNNKQTIISLPRIFRVWGRKG